MVPERSSSSYQRDQTRILAPFQGPTPLSAYFLLSILQDRAMTAGSKQRRYAMSQKVLSSLGAIGCAVAMLFVTSDASQAAGHGGGGHGEVVMPAASTGVVGMAEVVGGMVWLGSLRGRLAGPGGVLRRLRLLPLVVRFRGLSVLWLTRIIPITATATTRMSRATPTTLPHTGPPATSGYPIYSAPVASDNEVHVTVRVPADAQVWFENQPTTQQGSCATSRRRL